MDEALESKQTIVYELIGSGNSKWRIRAGLRRALANIYKRQSDIVSLSLDKKEREQELRELQNKAPAHPRVSQLEDILRGIYNIKTNFALSDIEKYRIEADTPEAKECIEQNFSREASRYFGFKRSITNFTNSISYFTKLGVGGFLGLKIGSTLPQEYGGGLLSALVGALGGVFIAEKLIEKRELRKKNEGKILEQRLASIANERAEVTSKPAYIEKENPNRLKDFLSDAYSYRKALPFSVFTAGLFGLDIYMMQVEIAFIELNQFVYEITGGGYIPGLLAYTGIFGAAYGTLVYATFQMLDSATEAFAQAKEERRKRGFLRTYIESRFDGSNPK